MSRWRLTFSLAALLAVTGTSAMADVALTDKAKLRSESRRETISLVDGSGLEWFINTDVTSTTSSASGAAQEASYTTAVTATTSLGGTTLVTLGDAFDGYGALVVNGTHYTNNGPPTLEANGRQIAFNPQTIGNLQVTRKVFIPENDAFARWLNIIKNTGTVTELVTVQTDNNLGSDTATTIEGTSSGDLVATTSDFWVATNGDFGDPRLAHVLQGPGARAPLSDITFANGSDQPFWEYTFSLDPGETGIIMFFASGQPTIAQAIAKAGQLTGLPANTLRYMTMTEQLRVLNFTVDAQPYNREGDFNGDGMADILWRNLEDGNNTVWLMSGSTVIGTTPCTFPAPCTGLGSVPLTWQSGGLADFNSDGKADILWRDQQGTGDIAFWFMNGASIGSTAFFGNLPIEWVSGGVGDFNGDTRTDILWRNESTGQIAIWFMNGAGGISSSALVGTLDTNYEAAGVIDLNNNGRADIVWRNQATGEVAVWLMNGSTVASAALLGTVPTSYGIMGVGDFDGDGNGDILWRNRDSTGENGIWLMNGTTIKAAVFSTTLPDSAWRMRGAGRYDANTKADILWRNIETGENAIWFMDGTTLVAGAFITPVPDTNWLDKAEPQP